MFRSRIVEQLILEGMLSCEFFTWVGAHVAEESQESILRSERQFESWQVYIRERDSYDQTKPTNQ